MTSTRPCSGRCSENRPVALVIASGRHRRTCTRTGLQVAEVGPPEFQILWCDQHDPCRVDVEKVNASSGEKAQEVDDIEIIEQAVRQFDERRADQRLTWHWDFRRLHLGAIQRGRLRRKVVEEGAGSLSGADPGQLARSRHPCSRAFSMASPAALASALIRDSSSRVNSDQPTLSVR